MTNREREYAALGLEYAEGIEQALVIILPWSGRECRRTDQGTWEVQPWTDNYWLEFDHLPDALRASKRPESLR